MSNLNSDIDYQAVLTDLKNKRDKLDAAIAGIETMLGLQAASISNPPGESKSRRSGGSDSLGPGAFLGMTIVDAAVKLLRANRRNMRTDEILNELKSGGMTLTSS